MVSEKQAPPYTADQIATHRTAWIEALLSGTYRQGVGILRDGEFYCCLGVLCDLAGLGSWHELPDGAYTYRAAEREELTSLPPEVREYVGLASPTVALDAQVLEEYPAAQVAFKKYLASEERRVDLATAKEEGKPAPYSWKPRTVPLTLLNDFGVDFPTIAAILADLDRWEVKQVAGIELIPHGQSSD